MARNSWQDGLLTALVVFTAAMLLHRTGAWHALADIAHALLQAGREPDLRWLWIAWLAALVALARRAAAR